MKIIKFLFGVVVLSYLSLILFFQEENPALKKELLFFCITPSLIVLYLNREKIQGLAHFLFIIISLLFLVFSFYFGMIYLGDSQIPRLKLYLKGVYLLTLCYALYAFVQNKFSNKLIFVFTVIACSQIFLSWFLLGHTLREIPLLLYSIYGSVIVQEEEEQNFWKWNIFDSVISVFALIVLISTFQSENLNNNFFGLAHVFTGLYVYFILRVVHETIEIKYVLQYLLNFFLLAMFVFFVFVLVVSQSSETGKGNQLGGFNVNSIGGIIAILFPLLLFQFLNEKELKYKFLYLFFVLATFFVLNFTTSRSSMLAIFISSSLVLFFFSKNHFQKYTFNKKIFFILLSILFLFAAFSIVFYLNQNPQLLEIKAVVIRFAIWKLFLNRIFQFGLFWGFGPENLFINGFLPTSGISQESLVEYISFLKEFGANLHAHNLIIQIFFNFGLFGLLCALMLFIIIVYFFFKNKTIEHKIATLCFFSLCVQGVFEYTLADTGSFLAIMIFLAFISVDIKRKSLSLSIQKIISKVFILFSVFMFFLFLLVSYNLIIFQFQKSLFKNTIKSDSFANLYFNTSIVHSKDIISKIENAESKVLLDFYDDRRHQFLGEMYFTYFTNIKKNENKTDLELLQKSEKNYQKCIQFNSYNPLCLQRMYQIQLERKNYSESKRFLNKAKEQDPFGIILK
ncbi:MAG: O-antigen ligase family protein [Leptospiraceae bacterium]|nr:O-antigen ligase family protein [Leptospiraceae bacterium]MCK6381955.1 O-antigen ligase family protein [Leptospiraceae bacterium]NUM40293.1 O-antigen ligase family protein [Leptospiraceae bacterium]